jgi:hypothetical protein
MTLWGLAVQTVAGFFGAHAAASAAHERRFGFIGRSVAGLVELWRSPIATPAPREANSPRAAARSADLACSTTRWPSPRSVSAAARPSPSVLPVIKTSTIRRTSAAAWPTASSPDDLSAL